jgi:hypothetical protein
MKIPTTKLSVIELAMWATFVAVVAMQYTERRLAPFLSTDNQEAEAFAQKYGPSLHSGYVEEWILKDFFQDRRDRVFVDVGANHYEQGSNTYYWVQPPSPIHMSCLDSNRVEHVMHSPSLHAWPVLSWTKQREATDTLL